VLERIDDRQIRLAGSWPAIEGLFDGVETFQLPERTAVGRIGRSSAEGLAWFDGSAPEQGSDLLLDPGAEAPLVAAHLLTGTPFSDPLPQFDLRLATTRGTNALLERSFARTALITTCGFEDLPVIGDQRRPDLFSLDVGRPPPLACGTFGLQARAAADGTILDRPTQSDIDALATELRAHEIEAIAITFLHAPRAPELERDVATALERLGFHTIVCSHELSEEGHLLARGETSVVEAALTPLLSQYLKRIEAAGAAGSLQIMTSAGGLVGADRFRPKDGLLSGPAAGVVGALQAGLRNGLQTLIALDMGGTSTDVSRLDGDVEYVFEQQVGDARLLSPALAIETVAAGGGSICGYRDGRLFVGPESAGADPGPACYGAGGPFTLTDVHLLLQRLPPEGIGIPLASMAAEKRLVEIMDRIEGATDVRPERTGLLQDWLAIADETMAGAIREVSIRKGFAPEDHALLAFGGAGGLHAAALAERLGIATVLIPDGAGVLSAQGLEAAEEETIRERVFDRPYAEVLEDLSGGDDPSIARRIVRMRLAGQGTTIDLDWDGRSDLATDFTASYRKIYGYPPPDRPLELASIKTVTRRGKCELQAETPPASRAGLAVGESVSGPRAIAEPYGAVWVPEGWTATLESTAALRLSVDVSIDSSPAHHEAALIELFSHRFGRIAREMGEHLRRTAVSTNIRERLDFSCAVLDPRGRLVVNAPHIPVHLGALGQCVRSVMDTLALGPGDVVLTNHPAFGGSHLPDVTLIAPVFEEADGGALIGFVANRAHHAEIGGIRPGSTPPDAVRLAEEGVVLEPQYLVHAGTPRWDEVEKRLRSLPWPSRRAEDNLADLRAALASLHHGEGNLRKLAEDCGGETVRLRMRALYDHAADRMQQALRKTVSEPRSAEITLDDGSPIVVHIEPRPDHWSIDFHGSSGVHAENWNATPAIVASAVLYVLRLVVNQPLPLNEGLLEPVRLIVPEGMLNPPFDEDPAMSPAVVGGNTETSQRIVDALIEAFRLSADSQGTMNNVLFGDAHFGYYETIGGGAGAGPGFNGRSATHVHMTNTAITDAEVLERRFPVRLHRFCIRPESGGAGRTRGGDGLIREYEFLAPVELSFLAQRRQAGPCGRAGGEAGLPGRQRVLRRDGTTEILTGRDTRAMKPGDRFTIETPGGGGWGL
jgi:5-oxoprolinase (ATP-hydrolysing)